jgi:hypothetical protein
MPGANARRTAVAVTMRVLSSMTLDRPFSCSVGLRPDRFGRARMIHRSTL